MNAFLSGFIGVVVVGAGLGFGGVQAAEPAFGVTEGPASAQCTLRSGRFGQTDPCRTFVVESAMLGASPVSSARNGTEGLELDPALGRAGSTASVPALPSR